MSLDAAFDHTFADMTPGKRAAAMYQEAKTLADANVDAFVAMLGDMVDRAAEISEGGDIYPMGIRDICRKLGETATFRGKAILSITHDLRHEPIPHFGSLDEGDLAEELKAEDFIPPPPPSAPPAAIAMPTPAPAPAPAPAPVSAPVEAISFSPMQSAAEPTKIVPLHRTVETPPVSAVLDDDNELSEIVERLKMFGRRAGGGEMG